MTNPAARYGLVAEREFDAAPNYAKAKLTEWLDRLPTLSDDDFAAETGAAIHTAALTNSWRGNWSADDCKATACHGEAKRRHLAAGHAEDCTGDTIYSTAFARVWRSQGYNPNAYPPRACDCGKG